MPDELKGDVEWRQEFRRLIAERDRAHSTPKIVTDEEWDRLKSRGHDMTRFTKLADFVVRNRGSLQRALSAGRRSEERRKRHFGEQEMP